jgi:hypothetical protein
VRKKRGIFRIAYLVYCRNLQNFADCAPTLGRYLIKKGIFLVLVDANARISGLLGWFESTTPKYYKGLVSPELGDLSYTERVLFNIG